MTHNSTRNLAHVIVASLSSVCLSLSLTMDNCTTIVALNGHATCIGIVMLLLKLPTKLNSLDENHIVIRIPYSLVKIRRAVSLCVWRLRGRLDNAVVMDARVYKNTASGPAFVELIHA